MGILVFWTSIIIFIPLLALSIFVLLKNKKKADTEYKKITARLNNPYKTKISLFAVYLFCMMLAYYEYWQRLLSWLTGNLTTTNNWLFFTDAVLGWDSWFDIFDYWISLIIIYLITSFLLFIIYKKYGIQLYCNNNYMASIFNIGLYPFMAISFLGWVYKW